MRRKMNILIYAHHSHDQRVTYYKFHTHDFYCIICIAYVHPLNGTMCIFRLYNLNYTQCILQYDSLNTMSYTDFIYDVIFSVYYLKGVFCITHNCQQLLKDNFFSSSFFGISRYPFFCSLS